MLEESLRFNLIITGQYLTQHWPITAFFLMLVLPVFWWVRRNLRIINSNMEFAKLILDHITYVRRFPMLAAMLVLLTVTPFAFPRLPVSFFTPLLTTQVIISGIMLYKRLSKQMYILWRLLFTLFLFSVASNLFWEVVLEERWYVASLGAAGIAVTAWLFRLAQKYKEDLHKYAGLTAGTYIVLQTASLIANAAGRYSQAKTI